MRNRFPTPGRAARRVMAVLGAATTWMSPQAVAQLPLNTQIRDARLVPRGLLRLGFDVEFTTYSDRYSLGTPGLTDGTAEPLGSDLTGDSVGTNLFPALLPSEMAIRSITGDGGYRMNIGAFSTKMLADVRRVPLGLTLGITNRLTFSASVPLVRSWMRVAFTMDSTDTNVGWNQAIAEVAGDAPAASMTLFLMQLEQAVTDVQAAIASGSFGCPTSTQCGLANAAVAEGTQLLTDLRVLTGINSGVQQTASFAPLNTSAAGIAINSAIASVTSALEALGATPVTAPFQLPVDPTTRGDVDRLLGSSTLGYVAAPLDSVKTASIGDMELGLRYGLIMRPSFRTVLYSTARLPTGKVDLPNNYVDLGTGDQQFDVALGIETSWEPGSFLGIAAHASYTMQLASSLQRRVASPDSLLVPAFDQIVVQRDLGDVIQAAIYPMLRLTDVFRLYASATYYYKQRDAYSAVSGQPDLDLEKLARETNWQALSLGAGIAYRADYVPGVRKPIEAGVSYTATFWGTGGLTPKANNFAVYLRLFAGIFGGAQAPAPEE